MKLLKLASLVAAGKLKLLGYGGSKETYLYVKKAKKGRKPRAYVFKRPRPYCPHEKWDFNSQKWNPCFECEAKPESFGYRAIKREVEAWKKFGKTGKKNLARCRLLADGWSVMEAVKTLEWDKLQQMVYKKPTDAWNRQLKPKYKWLTSCTDGWQVGLNRKNKLVEYDYTDYVPRTQ